MTGKRAVGELQSSNTCSVFIEPTAGIIEFTILVLGQPIAGRIVIWKYQTFFF